MIKLLKFSLSCPDPDLNRGPRGLQPSERVLRLSELNLSDFRNYLISERKISETWTNKMISVLKRFVDRIDLNSLRESFYNCTDKKSFVCAVRDLIHYLRDRKMIDRETALDILESEFLKPIKSRSREIYLSDDEIREGLELIREKWRDETEIVYKFLVYTGQRLTHTIRALENFDRRKIEIYDNVGVYPMSDVIVGEEKRSFIALFPSEFVSELKRLEKRYKLHTWQSRLSPRRWKPKIDSRIDSNAIRKWNMNFLIRHGIDSEIANFIQGRSNLSIGSTHYLNLRLRSIEKYSQIVDKFPI